MRDLSSKWWSYAIVFVGVALVLHYCTWTALPRSGLLTIVSLFEVTFGVILVAGGWVIVSDRLQFCSWNEIGVLVLAAGMSTFLISFATEPFLCTLLIAVPMHHCVWIYIAVIHKCLNS
jgi:hypothetical protein